MKRAIYQDKRNFFIMKPEALSQGRGIFLTRDLTEVSPDDHIVAQ